MIRYTDSQIQELIQETKILAFDPRDNIRWKQKRGHREYEVNVMGVNGHQFHLILRQNELNKLDFSVILAVTPDDTTQQFRLRRYNGLHGEHKNRLERETFFDYHIHQATERYQDLGTREDAYAITTNRFSNVNEALSCLLHDCGFIVPGDNQMKLFEE